MRQESDVNVKYWTLFWDVDRRTRFTDEQFRSLHTNLEKDAISTCQEHSALRRMTQGHIKVNIKWFVYVHLAICSSVAEWT